MSNLHVNAQQLSPSRPGDGAWVALRATRDGAPIVLPWFQALVLEGRVFKVTAPEYVTITITPVTLLAAASFGDDDATLYVDVADGTAALPLEVTASTRATGAVITDFLAFLSDTLRGTGGTETACTVRAFNRATPVASAATAAHTADTEADAITGAEVELFRDTTTFDIDGAVGFENNRKWRAEDAGVAPVGIDGCSINLDIIVGTSGTGYGSITWAELPENAVA